MGESVSLIKDSEAKVMAAAGCVNEGRKLMVEPVLVLVVNERNFFMPDVVGSQMVTGSGV